MPSSNSEDAPQLNDPGWDPLPSGAEDGFDSRIKLDDQTGNLRYKTPSEQEKLTPQAKVNSKSDVLQVWTDGACRSNGRKGAIAGVGVYFGPDDERFVSYALMPTLDIMLKHYKFANLSTFYQESCRSLDWSQANQSTGRAHCHKTRFRSHPLHSIHDHLQRQSIRHQMCDGMVRQLGTKQLGEQLEEAGGESRSCRGYLEADSGPGTGQG